jgi:predicted metalloprotease with PDZ domain
VHRRISQFSRLFALICFTSLAPCLSVSSLEAQDMVARHSLSFPQRNRQYVHVTLQIPVQDGQVELSLPNWTPGSYVIRDHAAHLERLQARDGTGRFLEVEKTAKNRWRIDTEGARELTLNYDVWAGELHVSSSWIESDFALLNGAGIFLFSEDSRLWRQEIVVKLPESWSRIRTSLTALQDKRHFSASNYDELVDSPIVAGNAPEYEFSHDGQNYVLVNQGESGFWDGERSMRDLTAIVKGQQEFWAVNPFDRDYLFLNFLLEGSGGLEHDHSTVMMASRWAMRNEKEYIKWLALVSHEFFHSWNVRRMRPEALANYDYDKEVYTRELWLAEGLTSYYDNLLLFRSRLIGVPDYFELLAAEFRNYFTVPGRKVRSAELASFDSWIKHYVPDANSVNSTVSYYRRGALIGFVTDTAIRRETESRSSLDDVMRAMYQQYGPNGPGKGIYPRGAFEEIVESVAGPKVRAMVEELLQTPMDPDVDAALDWYGLQLNRAPEQTAAELSGTSVPSGFGLSWKADPSLLIVEHVMHGGSAAESGVLPGDEVLAINGLRVLPQSIDSRINSLRPDEQVELTLVRNGQLLTLPVRVQLAIPEKFEIVTKPKMSRQEKLRLEKWLGMNLYFGK